MKKVLFALLLSGMLAACNNSHKDVVVIYPDGKISEVENKLSLNLVKGDTVVIKHLRVYNKASNTQSFRTQIYGLYKGIIPASSEAEMNGYYLEMWYTSAVKFN